MQPTSVVVVGGLTDVVVTTDSHRVPVNLISSHLHSGFSGDPAAVQTPSLKQ